MDMGKNHNWLLALQRTRQQTLCVSWWKYTPPPKLWKWQHRATRTRWSPTCPHSKYLLSSFHCYQLWSILHNLQVHLLFLPPPIRFIPFNFLTGIAELLSIGVLAISTPTSDEWKCLFLLHSYQCVIKNFCQFVSSKMVFSCSTN